MARVRVSIGLYQLDGGAVCGDDGIQHAGYREVMGE